MEHLCLPLSETYLIEIALLDMKQPGVMQLLLLSCLNSFDKGVKPQQLQDWEKRGENFEKKQKDTSTSKASERAILCSSFPNSDEKRYKSLVVAPIQFRQQYQTDGRFFIRWDISTYLDSRQLKESECVQFELHNLSDNIVTG